MAGRWTSLLKGYVFAVLGTALAALLRWALARSLGEQLPVYVTFYPVAVLSAMIGGTGAGVVATLLAALAVDLWLLDPRGRLGLIHGADAAGLILFCVINLGMSIVGGRLRAARRLVANQTRRAQAAAEDAQAAEATLRRTMQNMGDAYLLLDHNWRMLDMNEQAERLSPIPRAQMMGRILWDLFPDAGDFRAVYEQVLATGRRARVEGYYPPLDRWFDVSACPANGGLALFARDVTQRRRTEAALRDSEERLRMANQAGGIGTFDADAQTCRTVYSPELCAILGLPPGYADQPQDQGLRFIHPEDLPAVHAAVARAADPAGDGLARGELRIVRPNGEVRWVSWSGCVFFRDTPTGPVPVRAIGACIDVTERKRAVEGLQKREASLQLLFDTGKCLLLSDHPEEILHDICDAVADHLGTDIYVNYLVPPEGGHLTLNAWRGIDEARLKTFQKLDFNQALCGTAACEKRRIILPDVQRSREPKATLLRELGVRAYACHPILAQDTLGTISFCARDRDWFTDEELALMRAVTDQVSLALERRRLTRELERRAAALDEANKAKDHFLAVLSHELRTPLTPVLATVSILQTEAPLDPDTREDLEMVRRNVELEARLIDDLLDMTRIARGKVELDRRPVSFCEILRRAVEVCQPDIEARRLHFGLDIEPGPYWTEADAGRLQQVFWNLIKNAVKFTPPGGCLGIRCRHVDGHLLAEVEDSGEGIEPENLARIFNAFEQAERSITRHFGGLGLGLAISKALVEMHGGTIEAHSAGKGKGATFRVTLPLAHHAAQHAATPTGHRSAATGEPCARRLRVLLVEDHGDTARILSRLLARRGYEVQAAGDVATALELAHHHDFDLLISDLGLPDRTGVDLIRELRTQGQSLPAIALSGYGQEEDVNRSRAAGFNAHLTKPVDFEQFYKAIAELAA